MAHYEFTYDSVSESEEAFYNDVVSVLESEGIEAQLRQHMVLAFSEIFVNALIHGNQMSANKKIGVVIDVKEDSLVADITDQGEGGMIGIRNRVSPHQWAEGGRGVDLAQRFSDKITFSETATGGLNASIVFSPLKMRKKLMSNSC